MLKSQLNDNLDYISPYVSKLAIISSRNRKEGINIKGISSNGEFEKIKSNIIEGKLILESDSSISFR